MAPLKPSFFTLPCLYRLRQGICIRIAPSAGPLRKKCNHAGTDTFQVSHGWLAKGHQFLFIVLYSKFVCYLFKVNKAAWSISLVTMFCCVCSLLTEDF